MNNNINKLIAKLNKIYRNVKCTIWIRPSYAIYIDTKWVEQNTTGWCQIQYQPLEISVLRFIDNYEKMICLDDHRINSGWEIIESIVDECKDQFTLIEYTHEDKQSANFYHIRTGV